MLFKRGGKGYKSRSGRIGSKAAYSAGITYQQPNQKSQRQTMRQKRKLKNRLVLLIVIIVVVIIGYLVFMSQFVATVVVTSPSSGKIVREIDKSVYKRSIETYFTHHPLQRFRFATDIEALVDFIDKNHPEVSSIRPNGMKGLGVAKFQLEIRQPVAKWSVGDTVYYVDADGVIFKTNYYQLPGISVDDKNVLATDDGTVIASQRMLSFIGQAVAKASALDFKMQKVEIPPDTMRTIYIKGKGMPRTIMATDREVDYQLEALKKASDYLKQQKKTAKYIDVRVEGKVFYK